VTTQVIVLTGGSSSGKSGIARCLQAVLPAPWLSVGVGTLIQAMPVPLQATAGGIEFAAGQQRVADWLTEVSWPRPDLAEFHLKLIAAAAARLADPLAIVDAQRRELLRRLREAQRAAMAEPDRSAAGLLLEGIVLRLQADLRWLEACERTWTSRREEA